jgi:hypothetical protein
MRLSGDDVTMYGLAVEHANGACHGPVNVDPSTFQCEFPYGVDRSAQKRGSKLPGKITLQSMKSIRLNLLELP